MESKKDIRRKRKQDKMLLRYKKKKQDKKKQNKYITKKILNEKVKNSQSFFNLDFVNEDGLINLKTGEYAKVLSVQALDLSLTSNIQKQNFFEQMRYLFQIKDLDLRMYKLDDMLDLNGNKDNYLKLIDKYKDDEDKIKFLKERYNRILLLEQENLSTTSMYYYQTMKNY